MKNIVFLFLMIYSQVLFADTSKCPQLYPKGVVLTITKLTELCNEEYVSLYDTKAVIFTSEKFDLKNDSVKRVDAFRADNRLKPSERAELSDYSGSIYDRGHMAPAADMGTPKTMRDSFLLSNMTPQNKTLNRGSNKIPVPVNYVKCAYYSVKIVPVCYKADNKSNAKVVATSYSEVVSKLGFK